MDFKRGWGVESVPVTNTLPSAAGGVAPRGGDRLPAFADAIPTVIAYVGHDRRFRSANKACEGWFNLSRSQIYGQSVQDLVGPAFYDVIGSYVEAALAGASVRFEMAAPFDGSLRTMRMTFVADADGGTDARGFFVLGEDRCEKSELLKREIADRERVEIELAEKERLLSELVETAPSLVVLADSAGQILLFNRACEELMG